jgi:hypothetical protein
VCRIQPHDAAAPAEADDADAIAVDLAGLLRPVDRGVEILHDLLVGDLADHLADDLADVRHLRDVALAREQLGRNRHVAGLREAADHVLDVLVDAEDLGHHHHERELRVALGHRAVRGHVADLHLAGDEAGRVGGDGLRADGADDEREAGGERGHDEGAASEASGGGVYESPSGQERGAVTRPAKRMRPRVASYTKNRNG